MTAQSRLEGSPTLRVTPPSDGMPVRDAAYFGMDAVVDLPCEVRAVELTVTDRDDDDRGAGSDGLSPVTNMFLSWVSSTRLRVFAVELADILTCACESSEGRWNAGESSGSSEEYGLGSSKFSPGADDRRGRSTAGHR